MKAAIEKAVSALSGYGRTRRLEGSEEFGRELRRVETQQPARLSSRDTSLTPDELYSEVAKNTIEGDDILFSKNNIFLKQPLLTSEVLCSDSETLCSDSESSACKLDDNLDKIENKSLDNHVLIPGFLFVTTRGSNFGTTLILNWAPNSSLKVPMVDDRGSQCPRAGAVAAAAGQCTSVSIDLCSMEMIRIFYHMDEKGFIVSGELVVKSKVEEFKVNKICMPIISVKVCTVHTYALQLLLLVFNPEVITPDKLYFCMGYAVLQLVIFLTIYRAHRSLAMS